MGFLEKIFMGDIAKFQGKRFVVSSELNNGQYFDESLLKCVTGGESIAVRFLYGEEFNLKPQFPGILNWAVEECMKWQRDGMTVPQIGRPMPSIKFGKKLNAEWRRAWRIWRT